MEFFFFTVKCSPGYVCMWFLTTSTEKEKKVKKNISWNSENGNLEIIRFGFSLWPQGQSK